MASEFIVLLNGELKTYDRFEDIPNKFDNLIKFKPDFPPGPHTKEEHDELELWNDRMKTLLKRETK